MRLQNTDRNDKLDVARYTTYHHDNITGLIISIKSRKVNTSVTVFRWVIAEKFGAP